MNTIRQRIEEICLENIPVNYDHTKQAREYISEATDQIISTILESLKEKNEDIKEPYAANYFKGYNDAIKDFRKALGEE